MPDKREDLYYGKKVIYIEADQSNSFNFQFMYHHGGSSGYVDALINGAAIVNGNIATYTRDDFSIFFVLKDDELSVTVSGSLSSSGYDEQQ